MKPHTLLRFGLLFAAGILAGLPSATAGEVLDRIQASGVLRSPYPDIWPPAVIKNDKGDLDGFDVEVLREIGRRIGVKIDYVVNPDSSIITWEEQTSGQWQGKYDIVVNSMTPTAKRAEHVAFPVSYYYGIGVLAVNRNNAEIKTPADASGKRIGVLKASIYEKYLQREELGIVGIPPVTYKIDNPQIIEFVHEEEAYDALSKGDGSIDGTVNSLQIILELIKQGRPLRVIGQPLYRVPQSVAILPGDEEFAALLKKTVEDMHADGTLSKLSMKWFDYDFTED
jgi:polar amino acid transport system substrate-binding protein